MNTCIAGRDFKKHYYLIKKIFIDVEDITDFDYRHAKKYIKNLK